MAPKVREVIRRLEQDGWALSRRCGSHRIFTHPTRPGTVTVAGKPGEQLKEGTWNAIQKQAGWRS